MPALTTFTPKTWVSEPNPLGPPVNAAIDTQVNGAALTDLETRIWAAIGAESVALQTFAQTEASDAEAAAQAYADGPITISVKTGNYTLVLADRGTRIEVNDSSSRDVTIPSIANLAGDWIRGHWLEIARMGTGAVNIVQGASVTLLPASPIVIPAQYASVRLVMSANDLWVGTT